VLIIRDGWGENPHPDQNASNAIVQAHPAVDARLRREWPCTLIRTSGEDVGLPNDSNGPVMGNSEVGHQNIGAGRIVDQELMRITRAIRDGRFATNATLCEAIDRARDSGKSLHLMGLVSDGKVHSDLSHLLALIDLASARGLPAERLFIHAFTDGRDTPPHSAKRFIAELEEHLAAKGGRIASIIGRFWAMDRDHRWERVSRAWECLLGKGANECTTALDAVNQHHTSKGREGGDSDEFLPPTRIRGVDGAIRDGDSVVFFNFRGDRPRELVKAFLLDDDAFAALPRGGFERHERPRNLFFATMAEYETGLPARVIFARAEKMPDILGAWIAAQGLRQFRCAETEKFPHVTFFFNDYREEPFAGEVRTIIPSPRDVATYDLKPEMSALGVRDAVLARIAATDCEDLLIVNFANCDMVGHTGSLSAAIRAVQVTDECVGAIVDAVLARNGSLIVTADHGNVEQMRDPATGAPHTAHTNFTVPLMVIGRTFAGRRLREDGRLADIAPTLLDMMGLPQPAAMTGSSLLQPS
jgi:2,3-bisphosphoglycerate-independent phosphoglycerate mutase